jgi:putative ABC transport system permease protein
MSDRGTPLASSGPMDRLLQDVRYAIRMLIKSPGVTTVALLTIGVGTGVNATAFGFVSALLLRPAPGVTDPRSLVSIYTSDYSSGPYGSSSYPDYESLKSGTRAFAQIAAQQDGTAVARIAEKVERVPASAVTGEYFELLGVKPAAGRLLTAADTRPDAPGAAVLGYEFWQRSLDRNTAVLGMPLNINGQIYSVVGVSAEGFNGLDLGQPVDVWLPLIAPEASPNERGERKYSLVARLQPDATLTEAQAQVSTIANTLAQEFPQSNLGTLQAPSEPRAMTALRHTRLPPDFRPMVAAVGAILMAAVTLVLVIACANIAGLLVSRSIARNREMAIRLALGAGRSRLVRQLLTESLLLGIAGGTCGLLFALWTSDVLPSFFPAEQAQLLGTSVDTSIVEYIATLAIGSSLLFGLAPALHASRAASAASLGGGVTRTSDGRGGARLRRALVGAQIAAAVVLLVSSALLVQSLVNMLAADLGFGTREAVVASVEIPPELPEAEGLVYYDSMLERVRSLSGVQAAGVVQTLPLSRGSRRGFRIEGYETKPGEVVELVINVVSDGYFETMQIPLREGRTFDSRDRAGGARVAIVNDLLAKRFFDGKAVGHRLTDSPNRTMEIIGVVQTHKYISVQEPPVPVVYYPLAQEYRRVASLVARTDRAPAAMVDPIRREISQVSRVVPVYRATTLSARLNEATASDRLTASLVGVCGGMALLLATIGVYGVVAYAVVRRTREIGIRLALGARPSDVIRLVLVEGLGVTGVGVALGLAASALAARALTWLTPLYGVTTFDPLTYATVPALLVCVAVLAAWPPARRALRVDPNVVLRQE